jgi:aminopeptidase N
MNQVWIEDHLSQDDFRYEMLDNAESYFNETKQYMRPLVNRKYDSSWSMFDNHTYPGGCWRIHMLRKLLGDNVFWSAVQKYVATFKGKVVETEDFRKVLEQESGLNLTRFFDQWFYSKGFPAIKASYSYDSDKKQCKITFEQTQVSDINDIPLFNFDMDVEITTADGQPVTKTITMDKNKVSLSVPCSKPTMIRIDPDGKVLFSLEFNPGEKLLVEAAKKAKDVCTRILAYRELITIGTVPAMMGVTESILSEPFYGVRAKGTIIIPLLISLLLQI